MSRAHMDEAYTRGYASCARASSGVFARTEQHVGQLFDGTPSPGRRGSTTTRCEPPHPGDRAVFRERRFRVPCVSPAVLRRDAVSRASRIHDRALCKLG